VPRPGNLFVTIDGVIYVGSKSVGVVEKWTLNATESVVVMNGSTFCYGMFVDIANNLYCSFENQHRVVKQLLDAGTNTLITLAGNGDLGSGSNTLSFPRGIFVDTNLDLYVADCGNNRVQLFHSGQASGSTVAENIETLGIKLKCPTAIFLDADGYIFIVERESNRIVGSRSSGFYCVAGCSGVGGAAPHQLRWPSAAAFDNYGNIFVADSGNNRIQKLILIGNATGK
jgi:DNA-binding beta-propeller fold protein YncE